MTLSGPSRVPPPTPPRRFRSLASRLVAVGVLQFALFIATAVAIFVAEGPHGEARPDDHLEPAVIRSLEELVDRPPALQQRLDALKRQRIEISIYDAQRQLVASNVDPPLAIPEHRRRHRSTTREPGRPRPAQPGAERAAVIDARSGAAAGAERATVIDAPIIGGRPIDDGLPDDGRRAPRAMVIGFEVHGGRGYLIARGIHGAPPGLTGPVLTLICGFAILVLGALLTARWIVRPIDRLSRTARALGNGDLGARSRLARSDEIGELGHRVDEMADRIESLLVTEKELLANVAHELRTPLTRIGVALDLASEGDAVAARASLAEIAVDVSELETIVDDILTAMRFEVAGATQIPLRREVTEPRAIAEAAAARMRGRHPTRELALTIAQDLPAIDIDPRLFRRLIDNLLDNAHKYSPDRDAAIALEVTRDGDRAVFEVRDRGIGITPEDLPRVFTAFFRGDRSRSRETGGVGLGLTLAKRIAEAHGGTIAVTSQAATGTTVRVAIPTA